MSEDRRAAGRYEVVIDSLLSFAVYPTPGTGTTDIPWPERLAAASASGEPMTITFEERRFTWHPGTGDLLTAVTVPVEDLGDYEAERFAMERFLSAVSYSFGYGIEVFTSGASDFKEELDPPFLRQPRLKGTIHPVPVGVELADDSEELSLCLALVREGLSSTSRALAYLSYWKAIEVAVGDPEHQAWIGKAAAELFPESGRDADAWHRHLNDTRIAAAHAVPARGKLKYHPDDPGLLDRLMEDLGTVKQLAWRAIGERWPKPVRVRDRFGLSGE